MAKAISGLYKLHIDGWKNFFSGLGGPLDKTQRTVFNDFPILEDEDLTRLWHGDGTGKKIVSSVADDMTKNWISIAHDDENLIMKELMRLKAKSNINLAQKWNRLYGGAVIVMGIKDGRRLWQPVRGWPKELKISKIDWLQVFASSRVLNVSQTDIVTDTNSPLFNDVEKIRIMNHAGGTFTVHRSRCLILHGEPTSEMIDNIGFDEIYWGVSALQSVFEKLRTFGGVVQSTANILYEFIIGKLKITNLQELLAGSKVKDLYTRMNIIDKSKSMINMLFYGEGEQYDRDTANVAGLSDLLDKFMIFLSAETEIPATRLWGQSPKGENATGESDLTNYYDFVEAKQETQLLEPTQRLVEYVNSYIKSTGDDVPVVKYNSPRSPKPKEEAEIKKIEAETAAVYINSGVRTPEQIQEEKFPEE